MHPTKCGMWRCDTFVAWSFYSGGYPQIINNRLIIPKIVFYTFPFPNGDALANDLKENKNKAPLLSWNNKHFSEFTAHELNSLPYEKFVELADIPLNEETPSHIMKEWEFVAHGAVHEIKRGIFIDRLAASNEQNVIEKLLTIFKETKKQEIRFKIVQGIMIYYQNHYQQIKGTLDGEEITMPL